MGPGGLVFIKTPLRPPRLVVITSKRQDPAPPPSELASHCPPVGGPPIASVGDRGGGPGVEGSPCTYPAIPRYYFVFILIFFFLVLIFFFNKNFHFKHIYAEGICAVYRGELDPELEGVGPGGGQRLQGAPSLSLPVSLCPPGPLPSLFLLSFLFQTVNYSLSEARAPLRGVGEAASPPSPSA